MAPLLRLLSLCLHRCQMSHYWLINNTAVLCTRLDVASGVRCHMLGKKKAYTLMIPKAWNHKTQEMTLVDVMVSRVSWNFPTDLRFKQKKLSVAQCWDGETSHEGVHWIPPRASILGLQRTATSWILPQSFVSWYPPLTRTPVIRVIKATLWWLNDPFNFHTRSHSEVQRTGISAFGSIEETILPTTQNKKKTPNYLNISKCHWNQIISKKNEESRNRHKKRYLNTTISQNCKGGEADR